ncbi:MAG: phosphate acyltransferase PlsX [Alphaproteobacteria bacterium]
MASDLTISVDAMGGDDAPAIVLEGVAISAERHPGVRFLLYGDEGAVTPLLKRHPVLRERVDVRHTSEVVAMHDKPSQVLRRGRATSMWRAIESVKEGEAASAISAGNTGALMAMAKLQLRTVSGIDRPAIAAIWPTVRGESIVLDVGANVECDAKQLVDFALLGEAFARVALGLNAPTVGILNIGEEEMKGHEEVREADRILKKARIPLDYRGFMEGDDIGTGGADVLVTDGFSGNVALKTAEGTARLISHYMSSAIKRSFFARLGYLFAIGAFRTLRNKLDPRRVNGGVFLGLNGVVVKSHGGTDGTGFAHALDLAVDMGRADYTGQIAATIARFGSAISAAVAGGGGLLADDSEAALT